MKRFGAILLTVLLLGAPAAAQMPPRVQEALQKATPEQRQAAMTELQAKYPDLRRELREHLQAKYPNLRGAVLQAGLDVGRQNPGLPFRLAAGLVQDLGGEPLMAAVDVREAVRREYPDLRERLRALRPKGLRTDVIATLRASSPGLLAGMRETVARVMREKHAGLGLAVMEEVSRFHDEGGGSRVELAKRLSERQGAALRAAAVDVLDALATEHGKAVNSAAEAVVAMVQQKHPDALAAGRRRVEAEFPGLRPLVLRTLQEKHPGLMGRAAQSVNQRFPDLREQFRVALEKRAPGVAEEARTFLASRYPNLEEDVLEALR